MMQNLITAVFLFLSISSLTAQFNYHPPLNIPLVLSANFGEIRPNHFHMGVDFKTNGREGLPLFSIDEGYVSRIKTSPFGYGKVIYINHPNGFTSVYAHCSKFEGKIDSIVRSMHEALESTEIDLYFRPHDITIKKGQRIAKSGNTGSSTAPHLHFEVRDTKTGEALNPLLYGFTIPDHQSPQLNAVKLYVTDTNGYEIPGKTKTLATVKKGNNFLLEKGGFTLESDFCAENEFIGLAVNGIDTYDAATNHCGLYEVHLSSGKQTIFKQQIDRISFSDSRYVNLHTDYEAYKSNRDKYHKSFRSQHNPLTIYKENHNGLLTILPGDSLTFRYEVKDIKKNNTSVSFFIKRKAGKASLKKTVFQPKDYFFPDSSYTISNSNFKVSADPFTFYYPTKKNLSTNSIYSFGDPQSPIQLPIKVGLKLPETGTNYFIEVSTRNAKKEALVPQIENGWITSESFFLGSFSLVQDNQAPLLLPLNFNSNQRKHHQSIFTFKVIEKGSGIKNYDAYIDGIWAPIEFESKGAYFIVYIPENKKGMRCNLRVECTDYCNNTGVWEKIIDL